MGLAIVLLTRHMVDPFLATDAGIALDVTPPCQEHRFMSPTDHLSTVCPMPAAVSIRKPRSIGRTEKGIWPRPGWGATLLKTSSPFGRHVSFAAIVTSRKRAYQGNSNGPANLVVQMQDDKQLWAIGLRAARSVMPGSLYCVLSAWLRTAVGPRRGRGC